MSPTAVGTRALKVSTAVDNRTRTTAGREFDSHKVHHPRPQRHGPRYSTPTASGAGVMIRPSTPSMLTEAPEPQNATPGTTPNRQQTRRSPHYCAAHPETLTHS